MMVMVVYEHRKQVADRERGYDIYRSCSINLEAAGLPLIYQ